MISRKPTFNDWSKLAEMFSQEMVAEWMVRSNEDPKWISYVTIDHKQIIAAILGVYNDQTKDLEIGIFMQPEGKPDIGNYLINKTLNNGIPKDIQSITMLGDANKQEAYKALNFNPLVITYRREVNGK